MKEIEGQWVSDELDRNNVRIKFIKNGKEVGKFEGKIDDSNNPIM